MYQARLNALEGLWLLPPDIVTDAGLPLVFAVLQALTKNPLKQLRALACQDDDGIDTIDFMDVVASPLTADEKRINKQYVAGRSKSTHDNHLKIVKKLGDGDDIAGIVSIVDLFHHIPDRPLDASPIAYEMWVNTIYLTFLRIPGIGDSSPPRPGPGEPPR